MSHRSSNCFCSRTTWKPFWPWFTCRRSAASTCEGGEAVKSNVHTRTHRYIYIISNKYTGIYFSHQRTCSMNIWSTNIFHMSPCHRLVCQSWERFHARIDKYAFPMSYPQVYGTYSAGSGSCQARLARSACQTSGPVKVGTWNARLAGPMARMSSCRKLGL